MKSFRISLFLPFLLFSVKSHAEINEQMLEKLNEDYDRVSRARDAANPLRKDIDQMIEEKNQAFLKSIEKTLPKKEFETIGKKISKDLNKNADQIDRDYQEKLTANSLLNINKKKQDDITNIINKAESHLINNFTLDEKTKTADINKEHSSVDILANKNEKDGSEKENVQPDVAEINNTNNLTDKLTSERIEIRQQQTEALMFSKKEITKLQPTEEDTLFTKVSKAYKRNLRKIIEEEDN
jgi:hypothetical protein